MTVHFVTCDLLDANEDKIIGVLPFNIESKRFYQYGGHTNFYGKIVTVKCFEDNSRVKELLATDGQGRVLVVDGGASLRCALLGDMIAKSAVDNGWSGVIIYGAIRDVDEIANMPLGVMALGVIPKKSIRKGVGDAGVDINFGGVTFKNESWIYADNNGVIVCEMPLI